MNVLIQIDSRKGCPSTQDVVFNIFMLGLPGLLSHGGLPRGRPPTPFNHGLTFHGSGHLPPESGGSGRQNGQFGQIPRHPKAESGTSGRSHGRKKRPRTTHGRRLAATPAPVPAVPAALPGYPDPGPPPRPIPHNERSVPGRPHNPPGSCLPRSSDNESMFPWFLLFSCMMGSGVGH